MTPSVPSHPVAARRGPASRLSPSPAAGRPCRRGRADGWSAASKTAAAGAALLVSWAAQAALPFGTLEFVETSAIAGATEQIDVRVRFTLDPASPALSFSSDPLTGFDSADLPTTGTFFNPDTQQDEVRPIDSITGAFLNTYFSCDDTFTGGCNADPTNYTYTFFTSSQPGKPSINFVGSFDLQPGASYEYVFAQFTPVAGGAQPGSYSFFDTGLTLNFVAFDAGGNQLDTQSFTLGQTCPGGSGDGCAFTRTVTAVPEPGTWALLFAGMGVIGRVARRPVRTAGPAA